MHLPSASIDLGRNLRRFANAHAAGPAQSPPLPSQLLAVLQDCHGSGHCDRLVYEFVLRRQSFFSLLRELAHELGSGQGNPPQPQTGAAAMQLAVIAILEDARPIFSSVAFGHIAAFLEGFTAVPVSIPNAVDLRVPATALDASREEHQVEADPVLQTAVEIAQRQGHLDSGKLNRVHSGRSSLLHYHLLDRDGRTIARVNHQLLKARLREGQRGG